MKCGMCCGRLKRQLFIVWGSSAGAHLGYDIGTII